MGHTLENGVVRLLASFSSLHHAEVVGISLEFRLDIDTLHHVDVVGIGLEYRVDVGDLPDMVGDGGVLRFGLREQQLHWKYMASEILPS